MSKHEGNDLRFYLRKNGVIQEEFAIKTGISRSTLLNYLNLAELPAEYKQMLKKLKIEWANVDTPELIVAEPTPEYTTIGATILHVPIEAEAGFIGGQMTPVFNQDLKQWHLPGFDEPGYSFRVRGDSMYPTFKEGEIVVTGIRQEPYDHIKKEYVYVIVNSENILIKRLVKKSEGVLTMVSDNPEFAPKEIKYDDVKIYRGRRNVSWDLSKRYVR